jgi:hypothetical protein
MARRVIWTEKAQKERIVIFDGRQKPGELKTIQLNQYKSESKISKNIKNGFHIILSLYINKAHSNL